MMSHVDENALRRERHERIEAQLAVLQKITDTDEGITRLAFAPSDLEGQKQVITWMEEAGLRVRRDAFGNMFARVDGRDSQAPPIMMGSHLDSVTHGGNYDGVVGVLAALEVACVLNYQNRLAGSPKHKRSLEVVVFMAEEFSRFGVATLGSQAMIGTLSPHQFASLVDNKGVSLQDALDAANFFVAPKDDLPNPEDIYAFLEVHIEQGKVLEEENMSLGIVTGIAAPSRCIVSLEGVADHSGATPMRLRHDALCCAAEIILAVETLGAKETAPEAVGTVGTIDITPGAINVIPGSVTLGIDIRSIDKGQKERLEKELSQSVDTICKARSIDYHIQWTYKGDPVILAPRLISLWESICKKENYSYREMMSGAGHDAMHMATVAPTGMLFIPCADGISHNPAEKAEVEDICRAIHVLEEAVLQLCNE